MGNEGSIVSEEKVTITSFTGQTIYEKENTYTRKAVVASVNETVKEKSNQELQQQREALEALAKTFEHDKSSKQHGDDKDLFSGITLASIKNER